MTRYVSDEIQQIAVHGDYGMTAYAAKGKEKGPWIVNRV
jgi:hypothetical protein